MRMTTPCRCGICRAVPVAVVARVAGLVRLQQQVHAVLRQVVVMGG